MKPYSTMSPPERWQWHAEVYAFRRICLGVSADEHTSPCDPDGQWFTDSLVSEAERRMRQRREHERTRREKYRLQELALEGLDILNKWAHDRGYPDFAAAEQDGWTTTNVSNDLLGVTEQRKRA